MSQDWRDFAGGDPAALPVYRRIADELRYKVTAGELDDGDQLPSENVLMEQYGVSRATARQALRVLIDEGLAVARRGSGVYVRQYRPLRRHEYFRPASAGRVIRPADTDGRTKDRAIGPRSNSATQPTDGVTPAEVYRQAQRQAASEQLAYDLCAGRERLDRWMAEEQPINPQDTDTDDEPDSSFLHPSDRSDRADRPFREESQAELSGQNCTVLLIDMAQFGKVGRTDGDRLAMVNACYGMLENAFASAGVDWNTCHSEDRGDGALVIIPGNVPTETVVHRLVHRLATNLRQYNRRAVARRRFSLRAAVDVGPVTAHEHGVGGETIISAARLVEATRLKAAVLEPDVVIGVATSLFVFERVARHLPEADAYEQVRFKAKDWRASAWIRLYRD